MQPYKNAVFKCKLQDRIMKYVAIFTPQIYNKVHTFGKKFGINWKYFAHSAWSESSAACPRPRGGRWKGQYFSLKIWHVVEI